MDPFDFRGLARQLRDCAGPVPGVVNVALQPYDGATRFTNHCGPRDLEITAGALGAATSYTIPDRSLITQNAVTAFSNPGLMGTVPCFIGVHSGGDTGDAPRDGAGWKRAEIEVNVGQRLARENRPHPAGRGHRLPAGARATALDWAKLLRRVFLLEVLACACGGKRRVSRPRRRPRLDLS